ncbi:MAG: hypothetical protein J7507_00425 [Pseudoxanthomonas sp.]|nr:hypothetical protein [Pseudoxanthomonas sp.]
MNRKAPFLLGISVVSMATAQICLKQAGLNATARTLLQNTLLNPWMGASLAAFGLGFASWFLTLRHMPLSRAYPWTALLYLITPIAGNRLFGEPLGGGLLFGTVLVVAGLAIVTQAPAVDDAR